MQITFDKSAPEAAAIKRGINALILMSTKITSKANNTPAIGALKAPAIPPAAPAANNNVLSLYLNLYVLCKIRTNGRTCTDNW
jgi:hypothetical protein